MNNLEMAALTRHVEWLAFDAWRTSENRRLVLLTTKSARPYTAFEYSKDDVLLFGRESAGVPDNVHDAADDRLTIPMTDGTRSLNLAMSVAMVTGEALRQVRGNA